MIQGTRPEVAYAAGSPTPAILLGLHLVSLQVARSLGRRGIRVFGIDTRERVIARHSRFIEEVDAPPFGGELAEYLVRFADRLGCRPVLYPMCDAALCFLINHWDRLAERLQFPPVDPELLRSLVDKSLLLSLLDEHGIAHPRTSVGPRGLLTLPRGSGIGPPFVAKPRFHSCWREQPVMEEFYPFDPRVLLIEDEQEAGRTQRLLGLVGDTIWQEFVPGPSSNHLYYVGYRDRSGRMIASFLGCKVHTLPDCLGSETALISVHVPPLRDLGDRILHQIGYVGSAGIDFKRDERDGTYNVIEINCRIGLNDGYLSTRGVDIPYLYYLDSQGLPVSPVPGYPEGVVWRDFFQDARWMRLHGARDGQSWPAWLRQAIASDVDSVFDSGDLGPFRWVAADELRHLISSLWKRARGRRSPVDASARRGGVLPSADVPVIRDCVLAEIEHGSRLRDPILAYGIVRELRLLGFLEEEALRLMAGIWGPRSQPAPSTATVGEIVAQGYHCPEPLGSGHRDCGDCESLSCVGPDRCFYIRYRRESGLRDSDLTGVRAG